MQNGLNVARRKTVDPDSGRCTQPKKIKEKEGRFDYITITTQLQYGWHHHSRIKGWGGGISVAGGRRRRVEGDSAETSRGEWEEKRERAREWERVIIMRQAESTGWGLSFVQKAAWDLTEETEKMRAGWCLLCDDPDSPNCSSFLQEDKISLSVSIRSISRQQESSSSSYPEHTSVPPADVNSNEPHSARAGLRRKQGERSIWEQNRDAFQDGEEEYS